MCTAALAVLFFAGRWLVHALASDETRIRWVVEDMVDGFNAQRNDRVLAGLAKEFRDETSGATRDDVRQALAYAFFNEVDPKTNRFRLKARMADAPPVVQVQEGEPPTAKAAVAVDIALLREDREERWWDARVEGELLKRDGEWLWVRTTAVNHDERVAARRGRR